MVNVEEFVKAQRSEGPATILAIGTATPPTCIPQTTYPDYYFRVTKSEHKKELKETFRRMCNKSMVEKRYTYLTEELLNEKPNFCAHMAPSLEERQEIAIVEIPKLGAQAAAKAIKEWGQHKSKITHVVFCSTTGIDMPGADYHMIKLLGLQPSVKRVMMYSQGCFAGGTVLRLAKDMAENNKGARVLVVCSEITAVTFRGPDEAHVDSLVGQALFGDGASAVIVGCTPLLGVENSIFQIITTSQTVLPDTEGAIKGHLGEAGLTLHLVREVPQLIAQHIEKSLIDAFQPFGIVDWNSLFWVPHPGGRAILDKVEERLNLKLDKLRATRHVLNEYGNLSCASVLFILNEMRLSSAKDGSRTTGEGLDWGVLFGFGPGLTVDTVVLHSVSI